MGRGWGVTQACEQDAAKRTRSAIMLPCQSDQTASLRDPAMPDRPELHDLLDPVIGPWPKGFPAMQAPLLRSPIGDPGSQLLRGHLPLSLIPL